MAAAAVRLPADIPRSGQGEMDANPRPAPKVRRIRAKDTATVAPARMDPQEAPGPARSRAASSTASDAEVTSIMMPPQLCEHIASSNITGRGTPSIHNKIPRPIVNSLMVVQIALEDT